MSSNFRSKLEERLQQIWVKVQPKLLEYTRRSVEFTSRKATEWQLRDKLIRVLPQDLASSLPKTFEPLAVAEWLSQAFQKRGTNFYLILITIFFTTYFLADVTAIFVGRYIPEPPASRVSRYGTQTQRPRTMDEYNVIFSRNLFSSAKLIPGEETGELNPQDLGGAPTKTTLPFTLLGTMILRDELRSIATIEDKAANAVYPVRIDDEIPAKAKIIKVEPRKVIFMNKTSGRREFVELPADTNAFNPRISLGSPIGSGKTSGNGVERVSPTQFNVSRQEVDKTLADLNNVLTQARCVPNFENGLPSGYKCFQIVPGSIYDKLGMQNGDTILGINGQSISDPAKAFEQLSALKETNHIELKIKRDGRDQTLVYDIR